MIKKHQYSRFGRSLCWVLLLLMAPAVVSTAAELSSELEKKAICVELTTLYRSARAVISQNQAAINDPAKGDKGLTGDVVQGIAEKNFAEATGTALPKNGEGSVELADRARHAMFSSIGEIMDENQDWINEKGKGFKGFLPAIFAKMVADRFTKKMDGKMYIKLTAPKSYVRNRANRPDEWEHRIIEKHFKAVDYKKGEVFTEFAPRKGKDAYRLILPEYYKQSCLNCHGGPKGERDITGGKKEGGKLGELGGAISIGIFE